jgi:hypothetical protein
MSTDNIGAPTLPLQTAIPSYLYEQYADDENLQGWIDAFNLIIQDCYLEWFNDTPLSVYTNTTIMGSLLDWIAQGIYGIERPVFSSTLTQYIAGINFGPVNVVAVNGKQYFQSGTATVATDDFYKRVLTWWLYIGDGRAFTAEFLRRRVARFIYGVNGTDISLSQAESISVVCGILPLPNSPTLSEVAGGTFGSRTYAARYTYVTPIGEGRAGGSRPLTVAPDFLLKANSAPAEEGATGYNIYVHILSSNPAKFIAGVNSAAVNVNGINGTNATPISPPTKQNVTPIAIGTTWTEPSTGLIEGAPLPSTDNSNTPTNLIITVPSGVAATYFQEALAQGNLAFPLQLTNSVIIA